jgi:methylenetetrahydrofolate reductase (NADPH)
MANEQTKLQERIAAGKPLVLAEISPPVGADPGAVKAAAKKLAGKVHAVGVSDNRDHVTMSAMATAALLAGEGVEPILHVITRDRNRIALVSDALGARALGIRNLLVTSGSHQTLGQYRMARNVFDIDPLQLLQASSGLSPNGDVPGKDALVAAGPFCLGAVANPYADPLELQVMRLGKKQAAGARFVVTQPIFDLERFEAWWKEIQRAGLEKRLAIVAGIAPLASAEHVAALVAQRPSPRIPAAVVSRLQAAAPAAQRTAGVEIAVETINRLRSVAGLAGFQVFGDGDLDAALEVIEKSALAKDL